MFRERDEAPVQTKPLEKKPLDRTAEAKKADELFRVLDEPVVNAPKMVSDSASPFVDGYQRHIEEKLMQSADTEPETEETKPVIEEAPVREEPVTEESAQEPNTVIADTPAEEEPKPLVEIDENYYRYIGEAFGTYIIVEKNPRELMLIDKHAAHERMVYESLKKEKGSGSSQLLLTPITVTLNKQDYNAVKADLDAFSEAGFDIEDFGSGTIIVRSAPQYLPLGDIEPSVIEMAGYLSEHKKDIRSEKMEWIYANVACRAAVKGGDRSTDRELIELARRVENEDIRHCPHGRPVCIVLKKHELERSFGRVE